MRNDWVGRFLPFWALGTVAWITVGFVLAPDAFRLSLFADDGTVWQTSGFDHLVLNWHVARLLASIVAPPVVVALLVLVIAVVTGRREARRLDERLYK
jgi:hypothetical protein